MYRDCPPAAKVPKADQVPSGVGVLPMRTLIATLESDGTQAGMTFLGRSAVSALRQMLCQVVLTPASNTRDVNVPEAA